MAHCATQAAIISEFFLTALVKCEMSQRNAEALARLCEYAEEWETGLNTPVDRLATRIKESVQQFVIEAQEEL